MLHWTSLAVLVAGLLSVGPAGIRAQESTVVCLSSFDWMLNSKSQNPCVVTAYLSAVCTDNQYTITPLPADYHYLGPNLNQANPCQCNTITYNMMSACGLCQNRTIISWPTWDFNCTTIYPEVYPYAIPEGTAVPHWAYQNVTSSGSFDVILAQSVGDNPESTASVAQSTATAATTSTSPSVITTPTPPSILPTSSSPKTNVGAIAGGVVGGVVGAALIAAVVVFFVMKKRRSQIPPLAQFAGHPPPMYPSNGYALQPVTPTSPYSSQMTQSKLYDPSDPSTFPVAPPPPTTTTGSSSNFPTSFVTYSNNPSLRPGTGGAYTGMPEV